MSRLTKLGLDLQIDLEGLRGILLPLAGAMAPEHSKSS